MKVTTSFIIREFTQPRRQRQRELHKKDKEFIFWPLSILNVVFFKFSLASSVVVVVVAKGTARPWSWEKFAILTPKLRSLVRIFIYRTQAISLKLLRHF